MPVYRDNHRMHSKENALVFSRARKIGKCSVLGSHGIRLACWPDRLPKMCVREASNINRVKTEDIDYTQVVRDKYGVEDIGQLKEISFHYILKAQQFNIRIMKLKVGYAVELEEPIGAKWLYSPPMEKR